MSRATALRRRASSIAVSPRAASTTGQAVGTLTIPLNVNRLHVWSKRDGAIPTAEIVIPDGSMTQLATNEVVDVGHAKVDDLKEFRAAVLTAVKGTP
jgi:hypothetical protein